MTINRRTSTAEIRNLEPRRPYVPGYKARRREREQHDWNLRMLHRYEGNYTGFLSHGSAQAAEEAAAERVSTAAAKAAEIRSPLDVERSEADLPFPAAC